MIWHRILSVLRLLIGLGLVWTAWIFAIQEQGEILDVMRLLIGMLLFLLGAAFLWSTLFRLVMKPFTWFIDLVFFPAGRLEKPILNLQLPAHYVKQERYDEALDEYHKIIRYHPQVQEAYERAIWLEVTVFQRPRRAKKLMRQARRNGVPLENRVTDPLLAARDEEQS